MCVGVGAAGTETTHSGGFWGEVWVWVFSPLRLLSFVLRLLYLMSICLYVFSDPLPGAARAQGSEHAAGRIQTREPPHCPRRQAQDPDCKCAGCCVLFYVWFFMLCTYVTTSAYVTTPIYSYIKPTYVIILPSHLCMHICIYTYMYICMYAYLHR
jgi:hypothetical protein